MRTPTRSPSAMASARSCVTSTVVVRLLAQDPREVVEERLARGLVQRRERLVEQQQLGLEHERAGQRGPLGLAPRERARLAGGQRRDAEPREPGVHPGRGAPRASTPRKRRPRATLSRTVVSARSGSWKTLAMRRRTASPSAGLTRSPWNRTLPAVAGLEQAHHPEQRGLAGAVGADDREDLARVHRQLGDVQHGAPRARDLDAVQRDDRRRRSCGRQHVDRAAVEREAASAGRDRSRGSRRRAAAPRPRGRSRPAPGRRARRAGSTASTWCRSPPRARWCPDMRFMWCAESTRSRSLRIRRTYSGRMKNASGLSAAGRYERVGEFTASRVWPRQRNWMRSGGGLERHALEHVAQPHDPGHAAGGRLPEQLRARGRLDHAALLVDHDAVAEPVGLGQVVGHQHRRGPPAGEDGPQLVPQRLAQRQVERGERLVEQEQRGIDGERAAEGHALALAARQVARVAVRVRPRSPSRSSTSSARRRRSARARSRRPNPTFWRTLRCGNSA